MTTTYKTISATGDLYGTGFTTLEQAANALASVTSLKSVVVQSNDDGHADVIINEQTGEVAAYGVDAEWFARQC